MAYEGFATMYDLSQRMKLDKATATLGAVVELQSKTNDFLRALPFKPCNNGTKEVAVVRYDLPEVAWRLINKGTKPTKSATGQVSFTTGGVEALADVDERLLQMNDYNNEWRLSENIAHQEGMAQKMAQTFFYGDEKINPAGFTGLSAYYYSKSQDAVYGDQIIDAGGTGNELTSLWICTFAPDTVYGIHPAKIPAGYHYEDMGRVRTTDGEGNVLYAWESKYNWDMGVAVRDPRYVVRLANIDLTKTDSTTFVDKMIEAYNQIYNVDHGSTYILCNRKVQTYLSILATKKANVNLRIDEWAGKKIEHFWSSPILRCDAILNTESQIV